MTRVPDDAIGRERPAAAPTRRCRPCPRWSLAAAAGHRAPLRRRRSPPAVGVALVEPPSRRRHAGAARSAAAARPRRRSPAPSMCATSFAAHLDVDRTLTIPRQPTRRRRSEPGAASSRESSRAEIGAADDSRGDARRSPTSPTSPAAASSPAGASTTTVVAAIDSGATPMLPGSQPGPISLPPATQPDQSAAAPPAVEPAGGRDSAAQAGERSGRAAPGSSWSSCWSCSARSSAAPSSFGRPYLFPDDWAANAEPYANAVEEVAGADSPNR